MTRLLVLLQFYTLLLDTHPFTGYTRCLQPKITFWCLLWQYRTVWGSNSKVRGGVNENWIVKLKGRYKILVWLTKPNAQYHGINYLPQVTTMLLHGDYTTPALRQWNVCKWPSDLAERIYGLPPTIIFLGLVRDFKFHVLCIICLGWQRQRREARKNISS